MPAPNCANEDAIERGGRARPNACGIVENDAGKGEKREEQPRNRAPKVGRLIAQERRSSPQRATYRSKATDDSFKTHGETRRTDRREASNPRDKVQGDQVSLPEVATEIGPQLNDLKE